MSNASDWNITLLAEHRDIAGQIGVYISAFALLETATWELTAHLLNTHDRAAVGLLGGIQSYSLRLDALERYLEEHFVANDALEFTKQVFTEIRECARFRNTLAHGLYFADNLGQVSIKPHAFDPLRANKPQLSLTYEFLQEQIMRLVAIYHTVVIAYGLTDDDETSIALYIPTKNSSSWSPVPGQSGHWQEKYS